MPTPLALNAAVFVDHPASPIPGKGRVQATTPRAITVVFEEDLISPTAETIAKAGKALLVPPGWVRAQDTTPPPEIAQKPAQGPQNHPAVSVLNPIYLETYASKRDRLAALELEAAQLANEIKPLAKVIQEGLATGIAAPPGWQAEIRTEHGQTSPRVSWKEEALALASKAGIPAKEFEEQANARKPAPVPTLTTTLLVRRLA